MVKQLSLFALLLLAGCGFTPLYGSNQQADTYLAAVRIANIPERAGQELRLLLEDRMHGNTPLAAPRYNLSVTFASNKEDLGIKSDDVATRARLTLYAQFSLSETGAATPPYKSSVRSIVSYNILTDPYATYSAEQDALQRGLVQVADAITRRVALHLAGNKGAVVALPGDGSTDALGSSFMTDSEAIIDSNTSSLDRKADGQ